jgi:rSAM/selenodomain-associated transferase 2
VHNEAAVIEQTLQPLQRFREQGVELIVVDGGSKDSTEDVAKPLVDLYLHSEKGRACQMNHGAAHASGQVLLFLHSDTLLPDDFLTPFFVVKEKLWGFFPVRLSGAHWLLRCVEKSMNLRSRLTRVATGDQTIWVTRSLWSDVGGFQSIPLMEDVELSKRLRKIESPLVADQPVVTSSRRWESRGVVGTILLMWRLRLLYFLGVSPSYLAARY